MYDSRKKPNFHKFPRMILARAIARETQEIFDARTRNMLRARGSRNFLYIRAISARILRVACALHALRSRSQESLVGSHLWKFLMSKFRMKHIRFF